MHLIRNWNNIPQQNWHIQNPLLISRIEIYECNFHPGRDYVLHSLKFLMAYTCSNCHPPPLKKMICHNAEQPNTTICIPCGAEMSPLVHGGGIAQGDGFRLFYFKFHEILYPNSLKFSILLKMTTWHIWGGPWTIHAGVYNKFGWRTLTPSSVLNDVAYSLLDENYVSYWPLQPPASPWPPNGHYLIQNDVNFGHVIR